MYFLLNFLYLAISQFLFHPQLRSNLRIVGISVSRRPFAYLSVGSVIRHVRVYFLIMSVVPVEKRTRWHESRGQRRRSAPLKH